MKKTIIKVNDEYYVTYNVNLSPIFSKDIKLAYVFKKKHDAVYYFQNILKNHGYSNPEYIEVK